MSQDFALLKFTQEFIVDLQDVAQSYGIVVGLPTLHRGGQAALRTAIERGIPNEATRKAAARWFVEQLINSAQGAHTST